MRDREECCARCVNAQRARPHSDAYEAVRFEQPQLEFVPAAFGAYRDEHALATVSGQRVGDRRSPTRIGHQPHTCWKALTELILNEDPELPVNRDLRQPSVTCLPEALDEQRPIRSLREDVRIEVVPLDAAGVGQDDLPDTESR